jgi:hypothetical protein
MDRRAHQDASDGGGPRRVAPGMHRSQSWPDFVLQHFGSFAPGVPPRAGRKRNGFRPSQPPRSWRCNRGAPHAVTPPDQNHRLAFAVASSSSSLYHALQQKGDVDDPCPRAPLGALWVRAGRPRQNPHEPWGQGAAFCKRGQGPRAGALLSPFPDPEAAHTGSCSARRRKRPSAMRGASVLLWGRAPAADSRLRGRERGSTAPVPDVGFRVGPKACPGSQSL